MNKLNMADFSRLTPAERAVLECLMDGRTNKEIGRILCKSEFTVKTQIQRMLEKTGLDNRTQLSVLAQRHIAVPPTLAVGFTGG